MLYRKLHKVRSWDLQHEWSEWQTNERLKVSAQFWAHDKITESLEIADPTKNQPNRTET